MTKLITLVLFTSLISCQKNTVRTKYQLRKAIPERFQRPIEFQRVPKQKNELLIVEQGGKAYLIEHFKTKKLIFDISAKIDDSGNEEGLLGFAFDPEFEKNSYFYVNYTASEPDRTVISRFHYDKKKKFTPLKSEQIILEFAQPFSNHNGGKIAFGSDKFLYISTGDGGSGGDPYNYSQNLNSLLGKILRIDVSKTTKDEAYQIPKDNPFLNKKDMKAEIYAYGLRNVWKFSFDKQSNRLWAADVGQNRYEEINLIEKGKNYGWNNREGKHAYRSSKSKKIYEEPIHEYGKDQGISVTGGYVYRGTKLTQLYNSYIYGDFGSGKIWALQQESAHIKNQIIIESKKNIASFGLDHEGEIYICAFDGFIYQIVRK